MEEEAKEIKSISRTVDEQISKLAKRKTTVNIPKIDFLLSQEIDPKKRHILELIKECSKVIIKTSILGEDKEQITRAGFCGYYKFCPTCAARRSMKEIKYIQYHLGKKLNINKYHYYYAVVTIKSHPTITLKEVMDKILQGRDEIVRRRNNDRREAQKEKGFFAKAEGLMTSIEIVESTRGKGRNIHMNILFASLVDIPLKKWTDGNGKKQSTNFELKEEWKSITKGESYITHMEKIAINKYAQMDIKKSKLSEVFKYSTKFSSIPNHRLLEYVNYFWDNPHTQLISRVGAFRGLGKVPTDKRWQKVHYNKILRTRYEFESGTGQYEIRSKY